MWPMDLEDIVISEVLDEFYRGQQIEGTIESKEQIKVGNDAFEYDADHVTNVTRDMCRGL